MSTISVCFSVLCVLSESTGFPLLQTWWERFNHFSLVPLQIPPVIGCRPPRIHHVIPIHGKRNFIRATKFLLQPFPSHKIIVLYVRWNTMSTNYNILAYTKCESLSSYNICKLFFEILCSQSYDPMSNFFWDPSSPPMASRAFFHPEHGYNLIPAHRHPMCSAPIPPLLSPPLSS